MLRLSTALVVCAASLGACGGSVSMMFFGLFIGFVLQLTHGNYAPVFLLAGSAYLVAIGVIHLLHQDLQSSHWIRCDIPLHVSL